jgi:hypothetical protein
VHRPAPGQSESNVIDLMEALRKSLKAPPRRPEANDREQPQPAAAPKRQPRGAGAGRAVRLPAGKAAMPRGVLQGEPELLGLPPYRG